MHDASRLNETIDRGNCSTKRAPLRRRLNSSQSSDGFVPVLGAHNECTCKARYSSGDSILKRNSLQRVVKHIAFEILQIEFLKYSSQNSDNIYVS